MLLAVKRIRFTSLNYENNSIFCVFFIKCNEGTRNYVYKILVLLLI